jgi:hypothetical protein
LSFLLEYSFHDDIIKSIEDHAKKCEDQIIMNITSDQFIAKEPDALFWSARGITIDGTFSFSFTLDTDYDLKLIYVEESNPPAVSQSAYDLHGVLIDFASDVAVLMSLTVN